jgi:PTH1 family peptidyl-tRNA hydrolase
MWSILMKLIVGLGNPGSKYADTRHNVGFHVISELERTCGGSLPRVRFQGEVLEARIDGQACCLLRPQTYMNHSGRSVLEARDFYKLDLADLLVICDDFALPLGSLRVRIKGSSGGQKGLEDIVRRLGTEEIPRLRIGIGPVPDKWDPADFVLGRFTKEEIPIINESIRRSADAVLVWVRDGIQNCMNQYNATQK